MTQENKELLLKDLCARLPYGVKIHHAIPTLLISIKSDRDGMKIITEGSYCEHIFDIEDMKPYLRPMSSMTWDEENEFEELFISYSISRGRNCVYHSSRGDLNLAIVDWLNAHHFDYRSLIEDGLALEAPKDMYNIK